MLECGSNRWEALSSTLASQKATVMAHTWKPSIREVEAGETEVQGHLSLYSEFETTLWVVSNNKQTNINK